MKSRFAAVKNNRTKEDPSKLNPKATIAKKDVTSSKEVPAQPRAVAVSKGTKSNPPRKLGEEQLVKALESGSLAKNVTRSSRMYKKSGNIHIRGQTVSKGNWWKGPHHNYDNDDCGCKKSKKNPDKGDAKESCSENCCEKIAWIDIATREATIPSLFASLGATEPYLRALRKLYPSKAFETYFVPDVSAFFPRTEDEIPPGENLLVAQQEWWEEFGPILEDLTELVDCLVKRGFQYIGIPASSTLQDVFLAGDVIPDHPLHGGLPIDIAYPGVKFLTVGIDVVSTDALFYDNLWVFGDMISSLNSISDSLARIPAVRGVELENTSYKLIVGGNPALQSDLLYLESFFAEGGPLFGANYEVVEIGGFDPEVPASTYTLADIQTAAQAVCANSRAYELVVPVLVVGGVNTFVNVANEYDATAAIPDPDLELPCPPNPPLFSQLYTNVVYYGYSSIPGTVPILGTSIVADGPRVGVNIDLGIGPANGNPSIDQIKIGIPCDFNEYQSLVNLAFNPGYFAGYVWAANCNRVPQDVTGDPLRFHAGTRVVVNQLQWVASNPPLTVAASQQITLAPLTNPLFCAGGAFGY